MEYRGTLYGRLGRKYCPVEMTSEDVDDMVSRVSRLEETLRCIRANGYDGRVYSALRAVTDDDLERLGIECLVNFTTARRTDA